MKTELWENNGVMISLTEVSSKTNKFKIFGHVVPFSKFYGVKTKKKKKYYKNHLTSVWKENIRCVFRVKLPFTNSP